MSELPLDDQLDLPYPPSTLANGWRFDVDHAALDRSDTWALATREQQAWMLLLWIVAWREKPAGTLPADEAIIAAKLGLPLATLVDWRHIVLRGWTRRADGRLYHRVMTAHVLEMIAKRGGATERKQRSRAAKRSQGVTGPSRVTTAGVPRESGVGHGTDTDSNTSTRACTSTDDARASEMMAREGAAVMTAAGIQVHHTDARLLEALAAGVSVAQLGSAAQDAAQAEKGAGWAIARAVGQLDDARRLPKPPEPGPIEAPPVISQGIVSTRELLASMNLTDEEREASKAGLARFQAHRHAQKA